MRKQQETLLKSAQKYAHATDEQLQFLSREDLHMDTLRVVYAYFRAQNNNKMDSNDTLREATKWSEFAESLIENGEIQAREIGTLLYKLLPYEVGQVDTLIGDEKKNHIYTAYKRFVNIVETNDNLELAATIRQNAFYDYKLICVLLYKHTELELIRQLFEKRIVDYWEPLDMLFIFKTYPCIYDDYIHNQNKSLLWQLIERNLVGDFSVDHNVFEKLYDYNEHSFVIDVSQFRKYFKMSDWGDIKLNNAAIASDNIHNYPLVTKIYQFCEQNNLTKSKWEAPVNDFYCDWYTYRLFRPEMETKFYQCYQMMGQHFTVDESAWSLNINISCNFFITVTYAEYHKLHVGSSMSTIWSVANPSIKYQFMIAPDGKLYLKQQNGKSIPLSIKIFMSLCDRGTLIADLMRLILKHHAKSTPFFNDVIADCANGIAMPMNYNDIFDYHNRAHYIKSKYKASADIQINWNKQNINLSYLILKSLPKVDQGASKQILIQQKDMSLLPPLNEKSSWQDKVRDFLINIICDSVMKSELRQTQETYNELENKYTNALLDTVASDIFGEERAEWVRSQIQQEMNVSGIRGRVADYVNMCLRTKTKVRLDVRSIRQAINLHDMMAENRTHQYQSTAQVKIPKDSKFNKLREMLPDEFEWIKTRKRLIIETELQHHCVWSYATKITNDKCAIYSYVDKDSQHSDDGKPKRYTIEFAVDKAGKYKIVQVQGRYDREHTNEMTKYVQQLLDEAQSKKE